MTQDSKYPSDEEIDRLFGMFGWRTKDGRELRPEHWRDAVKILLDRYGTASQTAEDVWQPLGPEDHETAVNRGDLMAIAEACGGNRTAENVVEVTREDLRRIIADIAPPAAQAQAAASESDALDAARYRWLRGPDEESTRYSRWRIEYWAGADGWQPVQRERMDVAIDAAMQRTTRSATDQWKPSADYDFDGGENPPNRTLYILTAAHGLNMVVGEDMQRLIDYGRACCRKGQESMQPAASEGDDLTLQQLYEDACTAANKNAQDAARYRWLAENGGDGIDAIVRHIENAHLPAGEQFVSLDDAIDAAMQHTAKEGK